MAKEIAIAIDPSSTSLGYAIYIDGVLNEDGGYGCIKQKQKTPVEERVLNITSELWKILEKYKNRRCKKIIICEDAYVGQSINGAKPNYRIQGVLIGLSKVINADIHFVYPAHWRKVLNMQKKGLKRNDYKPISVAYVKNRYDIEVGDDTSDAICIGDAYYIEKKG